MRCTPNCPGWARWRHGEEWLTDDRVRRDLRDVWLTNSVVTADIENAVQELLNPMVSE